MSTYIPLAEITTIIHLSGEEIRLFLAHAKADEFSGEAKVAIESFADNKTDFTDIALVAKGNHMDEAIDHRARIEVRNLNSDGAAQVAAKGIWGDERELSIMRIRRKLQEDHGNSEVRLAGFSSFEFNRRGVDKALPIRFLRSSWANVLDQIGYTPGAWINSRAAATLVAADGDGTIYEEPRAGQPLPTLAASPAREALIHFLQAGGMFMLVSGNDLGRSIKRLKDGLPKDLYNRLLVAANGGADLVGFDTQGKPMAIRGYRESSFCAMKPARELDIVYIGNDSGPDGNDAAAFQEVGPKRSVLVSSTGETKKFLEQKIKSYVRQG